VRNTHLPHVIIILLTTMSGSPRCRQSCLGAKRLLGVPNTTNLLMDIELGELSH
jgi:hypothetical protein